MDAQELIDGLERVVAESDVSVDVGNDVNLPIPNVYRQFADEVLRGLPATRLGQRHRHILLTAPPFRNPSPCYVVIEPDGESPAVIAAHLRALYKLQALRLVWLRPNMEPRVLYNGRYYGGQFAARGAAKWLAMRSPAGELLVRVAHDELASGKQIHWDRLLRHLEMSAR